jgi:superfamily II DNA or RNA helicase
MTWAVGALVRARGREWVVLPESDDAVLVVRPLGGTEGEVAGLLPALEPVEPAEFQRPDPERPGDHRSSRLLRDAVRLGFRNSAGPFRSFAHIAVDPRPYQLVPLLMALKLDPVRLLVSDDVGVGKTVEACLIARELMDRGEIRRMAVLCPPHLAEQWQAELRDKFHLPAQLVLPGTVHRLETRGLGETVFDRYPVTVVSTDFIKSDRRRDEFLRACPELVIVDEAHTCAAGGSTRGARHQRHQLVAGLAANPSRHVVLVTATPHSGDEAAFRSLLALLDPAFAALPEDLSGAAREGDRRRLARHFVQRRRGDVLRFAEADTPFPQRVPDEAGYRLTTEYRALFERVLAYARETVRDPEGGEHRRRVRWWSALALLRSLASSPRAAAATLRNRAATAETETAEEADLVGRRTVLDLAEDEGAEAMDFPPGADVEGGEGEPRRRLREMAAAAERLEGKGDAKLAKGTETVRGLLDEGYRPIVFCRFIPTAEYLAEHLRKALPGVEVQAVTGLLAPAEREARVVAMRDAPRRVLVCTDCLSEGVNLQEHFDAVVHYDLSWNPTRHEQREGRVDRYGQERKVVRTLTIYGTDNQIDGIVLDVLLRKHRAIHRDLGVSVPVPVDTDQVVQAVFEGLLLRGGGGGGGDQLALFEDWLRPQREALHRDWDAAVDRERRSRTVFAQHTIHPGEVARELAEVREAIGSGTDVARFVEDALRAHGAGVRVRDGHLHAVLEGLPRGLRDALRAGGDELSARFDHAGGGDVYLTRTHPLVEGLATWVMDAALDGASEGAARRCGVIRTRAVERRTTVLLLRLRYHVVARRGGEDSPLLAEDCRLAAFTGLPAAAEWLPDGAGEALLAAEPAGNVSPDQAAHHLRQVLEGLDPRHPALEELARRRGREILESHRRVRDAARDRGVAYRVEPQLPPDVLGVYVYLPAV